MTIVERTFSAAVQHGHATHHRSTLSSEASAVAEGRPAGASPAFTAVPWEGLYLNPNDAFENQKSGVEVVGHVAEPDFQLFFQGQHVLPVPGRELEGLPGSVQNKMSGLCDVASSGS
jgi:hypothetical protein